MIRYTDASTPVDDILAFPSAHARNTAANEIAAARAYGLEVWVDAFNLEDRTPGQVLTGRWLTGLFTLGQELSFLRIPDVTLTGLNATVGTSLFSAFYSDDHAFGQSGPPTSPLTPGPAIQALAGLQQAIQGAHSATAITFPEALTIGSQHEPSLVATITDRPARRDLVLENLSSTAQIVDLTSLLAAGWTGSVTTSLVGLTAPVTTASDYQVVNIASDGNPLVVPGRSVVHLIGLTPGS